ncbi:MAG: hypothetical protein GEU83_03750 [Pseudonocardiaceae bacterium]|nr:hypothetical protein [Pseudonocardiaceae bacterium]
MLRAPTLPEGFTGRLDPGEDVLAVGTLARGGHLVLTQFGLWVPEGDTVRRIGWHQVSKAVWDRSALALTEAVPDGQAGDAELLAELPPRQLRLAEPGKVPEIVQARVTGSIRSSHYRELPGGGARFVQRKIPGRDGVVLQVRPDPGTDRDVVAAVAAELATRLRQARSEP